MIPNLTPLKRFLHIPKIYEYSVCTPNAPSQLRAMRLVPGFSR